MIGNCSICTKPIQSYESAVAAVTGYEPIRSQGGANAIRYRERWRDKHGNQWIAHETCLDERKRQAKNGPSLF